MFVSLHTTVCMLSIYLSDVEEIDYGDAKDPVRLSTSSSSTANQPSTSSATTDLSPPPQPSATPGFTLSSRKPGSRITRDTVFNADDFFIMKASSECE